MLKRIEKAEIYCIFSDVSIVFDDGKIFPRGDPRINKFSRRKRHAVGLTAKFTIGLTIGKYTSIVPAIDPEHTRSIPIEDSELDLDVVLKKRANEILNKAVLDKAKDNPIQLIHNGNLMNEIYWLYEDKFYKDSENLSVDEVRALLLTRKRMHKARINRAKTIAYTPETPTDELRRGFIPEDVRLLVWKRDGGKCAKCGSRSELQFDHIIPFSLGGGSTEDNLQILCGPCNRAKSNSL